MNQPEYTIERLAELLKQTVPCFESTMPRLDEIDCVLCGTFICVCDAFDLESSKFFCKECVEKAKQGDKSDFLERL